MNREEGWICTDPDARQYGRKITQFVWEYKQPGINDGESVTIDLKQYTIEKVEDTINSYGYTLGSNGNYMDNIYQEYQTDAIQIMCECLFEMEEKPSI